MINNMNFNQSDQKIIEREAYCPYCGTNDAFLISETLKTVDTIQLPEVGCTNAVLMAVTCGCWALVKGYPLIQKEKKYTYRTYGFCPHCGNTYQVETDKK